MIGCWPQRFWPAGYCVELTIIGSASAAPNPGSASSCYLLDGGEKQLVLECGHGAAAKLMLYTSLDRIGAILISHMHPDHFFDLVPLKYLIHATGHSRVPLLLPPDGPKILEGIARAMGSGIEFWESAYDIHAFDPEAGATLLGIDIGMLPAHHYIPAWAMRLTAKENGSKTLGFTSDTSLTDQLCVFMKGADLLLSECSIDAQASSDTHQGHLTPGDAATLAQSSGVSQLVLTHYPVARADSILKAAAAIFSGPCGLAVEGARYII